MIYKVINSEQADNDIEEIFRYIAFCLKEPQTAKKILFKIKDKILSLENMPERFRKYGREYGGFQLRIMNADNYCIFYTVDDGTETVNIVRVIYGGRDIDAELEDE